MSCKVEFKAKNWNKGEVAFRMIKDIIHKTMMITYMELQILWLGRIMVFPKETVYNS